MKTNSKSKEQIALAIQIISLKIVRFQNGMKDHWSESDYAFNRECMSQINSMTRRYASQYGAFPTFENIEEICSEREALVALLNEMEDSK